MANTFIDDLLKNFKAGQGQLAEPTSPFTAPVVEPPTVGPTLANEALLAPPAAIPTMTPELAAEREAARGGPGVPTEPSIRDTIMGNLAESRLGKFLGGISTRDFDPATGQVSGTPEPVFKGLSERAGVTPNATAAAVAQSESASPPTGPLSTPESIADLSFTGTPLTPDIFNQPPAVAPAKAAPTDGLTTLSGIPLDQFLGGEAIPEAGLLRAEAPLGGLGDSGEAGRAALQQAGIAAGTRAGPDGTFAEFTNNRGPDARDRDRAGDALSFNDARKQVPRAEGESASVYNDRVKAFARTGGVEEVVDTRTPEEIETDKLRVEEQKKQNEILDQRIQEGKNPEATPEAKKSGARSQGVKDGTITQAQADEATKRDLIGKPPIGFDTWAEFDAQNKGGDADSTGATSDAGSTPAASTVAEVPTITSQAEYDALPVGATYKDSTGAINTKKG